MKVSFDIGGVLSKYPEVFKPIIDALIKGGIEVYVITDIPYRSVAIKHVIDNGFLIEEDKILCADYQKYGEGCKEQLILDYKIDLHIDDFPGYCAHTSCVSLMVWPNPNKPYYADSYKTPEETSFGRVYKK